MSIPGDRQLSPHFRWREFWMDDGTAPADEAFPAYELLCKRFLEPLRLAYGVTTVSSGFRTRRHNTRVGGAPASRHLASPPSAGVAADVYCRTGSPRAWRDALDDLGAPGLGLYTTYVHVDTRKRRARW